MMMRNWKVFFLTAFSAVSLSLTALPAQSQESG
jgi:hypothetical protein